MVLKIRSNDEMYLSGSYVTKGGKISSYGTIRILSNDVIPEPRDENAGLECYSDNPLPYRKGGYKAQITDKHVEVISKKGKIIVKIPREKIFTCRSSIVVVGLDGWLFGVFKREPPRNKRGSFYFDYLKAFRQVRKGEKPCICDNSLFVKVPKRFRKRKLIKVESDHRRHWVRVFTKGGKKIWHQVYQPLSFAKWDPKHPCAKYSKM